MLKLKLQYCGDLMERADSLEKTLMLRKIEGRRRRGQERMSPGLGRWEGNGEGNGHPLQYSCLENYVDRGAWWDIVHGVAKSRTRLSN